MNPPFWWQEKMRRDREELFGQKGLDLKLLIETFERGNQTIKELGEALTYVVHRNSQKIEIIHPPTETSLMRRIRPVSWMVWRTHSQRLERLYNRCIGILAERAADHRS